MTFGRSANDRSSSAGFGPAPLNAPYGDCVMDGYGGHGQPLVPDGFGPAPARPIQFDATAERPARDPSAAHDVASKATAGPGGVLPHHDVVQRAFGPHDVSGIRGHTDGAAAEGSARLGAHAFATGSDVAFASASPDLHTAAHEAAHVVQQRAGVHLKDGLGATGDAHERQADAVADAVVRGDSAAALLGPVVTGVGSSVIQRQPVAGAPPASVPSGPVDAGLGPDTTVTRGELQESLQRVSLIGQYRELLGMKFEAMNHAVNSTCRALEVRKPKKTSLLIEMVNLAASAAIAGAAGVVAEVLARRLSAHVPAGFDPFRQAHQRFATDAMKDHLKKSFHLGIATRTDMSEEELAIAFEHAQFYKVQAAKKTHIATFDKELGHDLSTYSLSALQGLVESARYDDKDPEIVEATAQQIAVEWANLVARLHHGTGDWDPWAGELGSKHAVPTRDAALAPDFTAGAGPDASAGNVDAGSDSVRDAVDDDQRVMNPTLHGILEIDLWGDMAVDQPETKPRNYSMRHTRFRLYSPWGDGMRLAGVSDHVKELISRFPQVRELKMNKVVAIYDNEELSPPKPTGRFLITADGYVRRSTTDGGELELEDAADFAQGLSPAKLR